MLDFFKNKSLQKRNAIVGIFMLQVFPLLGNALSYKNNLDRRGAQLFVLLLCIFLILPYFYKSLIQHLNDFRKQSRALKLLYIIGGCVLVLLVQHFIQQGANHENFGLQNVDLSQGLNVLITLSWIFFFLAMIFSKSFRNPFKKQKLAALTHSETLTPYKGIQPLLLALSIVLAVKGWLVGPLPREVFMSFGGSTTFTGICSTVAAFTLLNLSSGAWAYTGFFFLLYLVAMSTSRTVLLLSLCFFALTFFRKFLATHSKLSRAFVLKFLIFFALFTTMFVSPAVIESKYFPYNISSRTDDVSPRYYREEYIKRFSRLLRLVPFLEYDPKTGVLSIKGLFEFELSKEPLVDASVEMTLLDQISSADARVSIYGKTFEFISKNPLGYWPKKFENVVEINCGAGKNCVYPHNFIFEVAFYFGWLWGLLSIGILLIESLLLVSDFLYGQTLMLRMISLGTLGYLFNMQFSGTFSDSVFPLGLSFIWLYLRGDEPAVHSRRATA